MKVPTLKQGPYLIATIQSALTDTDLMQLRDAVVKQVGKYRSLGVILDVTSMDVLDSFASRTLRDIAHMIRLPRTKGKTLASLDDDLGKRACFARVRQ